MKKLISIILLCTVVLTFFVGCGESNAPAAAWLTGEGNPSIGIGNDGDMYLNSVTADVYKKEAGKWTLVCNIRGEDGAPGAEGATGPAGIAGTDGSEWLTGTTVPNNYVGRDGDWYFNPKLANVYRKHGGEWKFVYNLNGDLPRNKEYSILFIGNSYTQYNNMSTGLFASIAKDAGYNVSVTAILKGGAKLESFANPSTEYGAKVEAELSEFGKYDFVILQEQSLRPALDDGRPAFYNAVSNLTERIRAAGAEPILYSTWGRKTGSADLESNDMTNESMTWRLAAAYQAIGDKLNIKVAHVGIAFKDVFDNHPADIELYNADLSHPSYEGSYLAATMLFTTIFNVNPMYITYSGNLSSVEFSLLRETATNIIYKPKSIPSNYIVTISD